MLKQDKTKIVALDYDIQKVWEYIKNKGIDRFKELPSPEENVKIFSAGDKNGREYTITQKRSTDSNGNVGFIITIESDPYNTLLNGDDE